jgi:hypothetical protein
MILAAFSYHTWRCQDAHRPLSAQFRERSWRLAVNAGLSLMLVSITVMPRNERWFVRLFALIVSFAFAVNGALGWWRTRAASY